MSLPAAGCIISDAFKWWQLSLHSASNENEWGKNTKLHAQNSYCPATKLIFKFEKNASGQIAVIQCDELKNLHEIKRWNNFALVTIVSQEKSHIFHCFIPHKSLVSTACSGGGTTVVSTSKNLLTEGQKVASPLFYHHHQHFYSQYHSCLS